jgi:hypothetical protein
VTLFSRAKNLQPQVSKLFSAIDLMVAANGGAVYTDRMYKDAEIAKLKKEGDERKAEEVKKQAEIAR